MLAHWRQLAIVAPIIACGLTERSHAVELNPAALSYQQPDQIKWNAPSAAGSQNSVLVGDPAKPGLSSCATSG